MTTRQLINRRFWIFVWGFLGTTVAVAEVRSRLFNDTHSVLFGTVIVVIGFGLWANLALTRCLCCGKPLGWRAMNWWTPPGERPGPDLPSPHCPHCDTSVDEDIHPVRT